MPFEGVDPWRWQYFEGVDCPESTVIPVDDPTGWQLYPAYRAVHDKLFICRSQGISHGPHGVMPKKFPVFSKPAMNLHGMGIGGQVIRSPAEFEESFTPGHMWMQLLTGAHISTDVALVSGRPRWWRHSVGKALPGGMFDYWIILARPLPRLQRTLGAWGRRHLRGFTGIVNFETIGGKIIECHLRMSEQWVDLNGPGWLKSVVDMYAHGNWRFVNRPRPGYSIVLFGSHDAVFSIDPRVVNEVRGRPGLSSVQITYRTDKPREQHAMPPGGFRLAIVNCWDLNAGLAARGYLRSRFTVESANGRRAASNGRRSGPAVQDPGPLPGANGRVAGRGGDRTGAS